MNEIDDALPRSQLIGVPHASAPGADATFAGNAGHFRKKQTGAADRALAIVDKVEVVGHSVDR